MPDLFELWPKPDHPHVRLLADLAKEIDGDTDARDAGPVAFAQAESIDLDSWEYMMSQRVIRLIRELHADNIMTIPLTPNAIIGLGAGWMDGFALGYLFAISRTDR